MPSAARLLTAILVLGTLGAPYVQPLWCAVRAAEAAQAHDHHTTHGGHASANVVDAPGHTGTCHSSPACGVSHVAPLRGLPTILSAPQQADPVAIESMSGQSAVLTATSPPPKR